MSGLVVAEYKLRGRSLVGTTGVVDDTSPLVEMRKEEGSQQEMTEVIGSDLELDSIGLNIMVISHDYGWQ